MEKRIDRYKSQGNLTSKIRETNKLDDYKHRIRGNCRAVLKRLIYDTVNAWNRKKVYTTNEYLSNTPNLPCLIKRGGKLWLATSPALIAYAEDSAFTAQTASNWIKRLKDDFNMIIDIQYHGNDTRILLEDGFFEFEAESAPPRSDRPPEQSNRHIKDQVTMSKKLRKLQRKWS